VDGFSDSVRYIIPLLASESRCKQYFFDLEFCLSCPLTPLVDDRKGIGPVKNSVPAAPFRNSWKKRPRENWKMGKVTSKGE